MRLKKWNRSIAINIALKENIVLNIYYWRIIFYFRFFYIKNYNIPNVRNLLNFLNKKYNNNYNSLYLYKLFPKGFMKQIIKITCLPSNVRCF